MTQKTLITAILGAMMLLGVASTAQAQTRCERAEQAATNIMLYRQQGLPMSGLIKSVNQRNWPERAKQGFYILIEEAYSVPRMPGMPQVQDDVVKRFSNNVYLGCFRRFANN